VNREMRPEYDLRRVMDIAEAADILRVSRSRINTWIEEGKLESCEISGISHRMVVVPSIVPDCIADPARKNASSGPVVKASQPLGSPAPRNPELPEMDPSFFEAAGTLLKAAEQIKRLVSRGTLAVVDGKVTIEPVAAYKAFLHS
jgi:hypothetical protein